MIVLVDFVLYSPMAEIEAPQVELAKMAVDRQKGLEEDLLD